MVDRMANRTSRRWWEIWKKGTPIVATRRIADALFVVQLQDRAIGLGRQRGSPDVFIDEVGARQMEYDLGPVQGDNSDSAHGHPARMVVENFSLVGRDSLVFGDVRMFELEGGVVSFRGQVPGAAISMNLDAARSLRRILQEWGYKGRSRQRWGNKDFELGANDPGEWPRLFRLLESAESPLILVGWDTYYCLRFLRRDDVLPTLTDSMRVAYGALIDTFLARSVDPVNIFEAYVTLAKLRRDKAYI